MISEGNVKVEKFFKEAINNVNITDKRKVLLKSIAQKILETSNNSSDSIYLNFICTHNSRRSQLAQVWGYYAASHFNLPRIYAYSGGTVVTAFYRDTVKTLQSVGFTFNIAEFNHRNPKLALVQL